MSEMIDNVACPVLERSIDWGYCLELQMATDNEIIWEGLEDMFSELQQRVCKGCAKRLDPAR